MNNLNILCRFSNPSHARIEIILDGTVYCLTDEKELHSAISSLGEICQALRNTDNAEQAIRLRKKAHRVMSDLSLSQYIYEVDKNDQAHSVYVEMLRTIRAVHKTLIDQTFGGFLNGEASMRWLNDWSVLPQDRYFYPLIEDVRDLMFYMYLTLKDLITDSSVNISREDAFDYFVKMDDYPEWTFVCEEKNALEKAYRLFFDLCYDAYLKSYINEISGHTDRLKFDIVTFGPAELSNEYPTAV